MIALTGLFTATTDYRQNLRSTPPSASAQSREERDQKVSAAIANGASQNELKAALMEAAFNRYSEEELVADEQRIETAEVLKARLREGIDDPEEALKAKAALVAPWPWSDEEKLKLARSLEASGQLDGLVSERLAQQRMRTRREMQVNFVTIEELKNQDHSGWTPDPEIWKPGPQGVGWVFALSREELIARGILIEPTAEMLADLSALKTNAAQELADLRAQSKTNPDLYAPVVKNDVINEANVAALLKEDIRPRIDYISLLIRSGEADKYPFQAGYGDRTTTSATEYLFWLQERSMELQEDGTYLPGMFPGAGA